MRPNDTKRGRYLTRRHFIGVAAGVGVGAATARSLAAADTYQLPFENGTRELVQYPEKRPLIRLTSRPPQLETPMAVFNEGILTPNDAFFVRYHLAGSPPAREVLKPDSFRLSVVGAVRSPIEVSIADLVRRFELAEVVAVNQCSGNGRGLFTPRVGGGQMGNGAMGCARWKGVRLADVLKAAGLDPAAKQVLFDGLDKPVTATIPDFVKSMDVDQALDPDLLLATEMNGQPLPWLNGFPLRLVVPGHYGTYWIKHLHQITVIDSTYKGYWMDPAYRIPDDPCAHIEPGSKARRTVPISRFNVRSFITSHADGVGVRAGEGQRVRGIAFDGGAGIREVTFSDDGGRTWHGAELGRSEGRFGFREWTVDWKPAGNGERTLWAKATNRLGESQPLEALWNPAGYMRNVVEPVKVRVA